MTRLKTTSALKGTSSRKLSSKLAFVPPVATTAANTALHDLLNLVEDNRGTFSQFVLSLCLPERGKLSRLCGHVAQACDMPLITVRNIVLGRGRWLEDFLQTVLDFLELEAGDILSQFGAMVAARAPLSPLDLGQSGLSELLIFTKTRKIEFTTKLRFLLGLLESSAAAISDVMATYKDCGHKSSQSIMYVVTNSPCTSWTMPLLAALLRALSLTTGELLEKLEDDAKLCKGHDLVVLCNRYRKTALGFFDSQIEVLGRKGTKKLEGRLKQLGYNAKNGQSAMALCHTQWLSRDKIEAMFYALDLSEQKFMAKIRVRRAYEQGAKLVA